MYRQFFLVGLCGLLLPAHLSAQTLDAERHVPLTTDSLLAYKVAYFAPTENSEM